MVQIGEIIIHTPTGSKKAIWVSDVLDPMVQSAAGLQGSGTQALFWTRPHMIRPAHATLLSSLGGFIPAPVQLSASHNVEKKYIISALLRG